MRYKLAVHTRDTAVISDLYPKWVFRLYKSSPHRVSIKACKVDTKYPVLFTVLYHLFRNSIYVAFDFKKTIYYEVALSDLISRYNMPDEEVRKIREGNPREVSRDFLDTLGVALYQDDKASVDKTSYHVLNFYIFMSGTCFYEANDLVHRVASLEDYFGDRIDNVKVEVIYRANIYLVQYDVITGSEQVTLGLDVYGKGLPVKGTAMLSAWGDYYEGEAKLMITFTPPSNVKRHK